MCDYCVISMFSVVMWGFAKTDFLAPTDRGAFESHVTWIHGHISELFHLTTASHSLPTRSYNRSAALGKCWSRCHAT